MKQITGILIAIVSLTSCVNRDPNKQNIGTLQDEIKSQLTTVEVPVKTFDFYNLMEGEVAQYRFVFKNTGAYPLVISNATATCGCTVPEKPEKPVLPGDTASILVTFNSTGRSGKMHKTVTVVANTEPAFPKLILKGNVIKKEEQ